MSRKHKDWRVARPVNIAGQEGPEIPVVEVTIHPSTNDQTDFIGQTVQFTATPGSAKALTDTQVKRRENEIPLCRQCPRCWSGLRGVGRAVKTSGRWRHYGCDQCGHHWPYQIPTDKTMDREVYDDDIETGPQK